MNGLKAIVATLPAVVGIICASAPAANAYAWSSSGQYATWNNGGYWLQNDIWGASPGNQTIYANAFNNWWVTCNYSGGGIKSYPAVGINVNTPITKLTSVTSWFQTSTPGGCSYDNAYDIWLNNGAYEVMIWQSWSGNQPIANSYNAQGQAIPTVSNVSIGGTTYNFYTRGSVFSFLRTGQTSSSWVDIGSVLNWLNSKHYYSNPTLQDVQFGWEVLNTGGSKTFTLSGYYCNWTG
jgi:hypothetical protein